MPEAQPAIAVGRRSRRWMAAAALAAGLSVAASIALAFPGGGAAPQRTLISETSSIRVEAQVGAALDFHDTPSSDLDSVGGCSEDLY